MKKTPRLKRLPTPTAAELKAFKLGGNGQDTVATKGDPGEDRNTEQGDEFDRRFKSDGKHHTAAILGHVQTPSTKKRWQMRPSARRQ